MDEQQLMQILAMLANSAPNQDFGVQQPQDNRLGMSQEAQTMGSVLNQLQGQGMAPPMPQQTGGGPETEYLLMQIIQALREQDLGQMDQMAPPANSNLGNSQELLKALLSGS